MKVEHVVSKNQFVVFDEEKELGFIEYVQNDNGTLQATKTKVYPEYEGMGYASMLLDALVKYAREKQYKIIPVCSYVVRIFEKYHDKYQDVIAKEVK